MTDCILCGHPQDDHRRFALSLERPGSVSVAPVEVPAPYAVVPVAPPQPTMPLLQRLELASIA